MPFLWGMKSFVLQCFFLFGAHAALAQCDRWQQRVQYTMSINMDEKTHRFTGDAALVYFNNSPDTLREMWFHMYFNAFRPGSEMDVRSRTILDPDDRVADRIALLKPEEFGEIKAENMMQDGKAVTTTPMGTIMRAQLATPLLPGKKTTLKYSFNGQVPVQIRRSGRNNAEGVAYSMSQWYPKLANYDQRGWNAIPYVGREFHGVWGDFDVTIDIDSSFTVAATGVLQQPETIGHGYATGGKPVKRAPGDRLRWRFVAKDVHDFAWAADPDYVHFTEQVPGGPLLHFFHKKDPQLDTLWQRLPGHMVRATQYMNEHFGRYPWPQYSFVQGGDGGMEYPMLTLITGRRRIGSLVGVSVHEFVHSWYHGLMASNEGRYAWMDEGFTEYASSKVMQQLFPSPQDPHVSAFGNYLGMIESQYHEPPSIHADHFRTNFVYGTTAYSFGEMLVHQLGSVIGEKELANGLLRYYEVCKFKHPEPIDLERVFEKESGVELDWYFDQWINTTRKLDYGINSILEVNGELQVTLERNEEMLMPVDLEITDRNGSKTYYHIPMSLMRGGKPADGDAYTFTTLPAWQWTDRTYSFTIKGSIASLAAVTLDPLQRMADVEPENDRVELVEGSQGFVKP